MSWTSDRDCMLVTVSSLPSKNWISEMNLYMHSNWQISRSRTVACKRSENGQQSAVYSLSERRRASKIPKSSRSNWLYWAYASEENEWLGGIVCNLMKSGSHGVIRGKMNRCRCTSGRRYTSWAASANAFLPFANVWDVIAMTHNFMLTHFVTYGRKRRLKLSTPW